MVVKKNLHDGKIEVREQRSEAGEQRPEVRRQ
jgi:hypothetical protein